MTLLTVHFGRFPIRTGDRVLDLGCGAGRHAFEAHKRGASVVAVDIDSAVLKDVRDMFSALIEAGEAHAPALAIRASGFSLPFPDNTFSHVIVAETLEHVLDDRAMVAEAVRVLEPGGLIVVTVPRWWPERICWALSDAYHEVEGGHVRIYRRNHLMHLLREGGLRTTRTHHAHALHAPFWWLQCLLGPDNAIVKRYHEFLVWDIMKSPRLVRLLDRALNPLLGKSLVVYAQKIAA